MNTSSNSLVADPSNGKVSVVCEHCSNTYYLSKSTLKELKNRQRPKYCSRRCKHVHEGKIVACKCCQCNSSIEKQLCEYKRSDLHFCSAKCSATYYNSKKDWSTIWCQEKRNRASAQSKQRAECRKITNPKQLIQRICPHCNNVFTVKHNSTKKKYCSKRCSLIHTPRGGYRPNSTRVHRCHYNGAKMDSKAEKKFAQILDNNNIVWIKNNNKFYVYEFENKTKKYYPDFYLPDLKLWIEIKGKYYVEPWLPNKLQSVVDSGEKIILIFSCNINNRCVLDSINRT